MPFGFGGRGGYGRGGGRRFRGGRRWGWFGPRGPGGPPENCICSNCGVIMPHRLGPPCFHRRCPNCGSKMTRQFF